MTATGVAPVAPLDPQVELRRVVERWHQLPLDHALALLPRVRDLVHSLADAAAVASGMAPAPVPDLGPRVVMDQLTVLVYDATSSGLSHEAAHGLADLRRDLAGASRS